MTIFDYILLILSGLSWAAVIHSEMTGRVGSYPTRVVVVCIIFPLIVAYRVFG